MKSRREAALALAMRSLGAGQLEAARAACADVLDETPADPLALHLLGLIDYSGGVFDAAIATLRLAVAAAPVDADVRASLSLALRAAGRPDEALAELYRALADLPHAPCLMNEVALARLDRDEAGLALAPAQAACESAPDAAEHHHTLGRVLQRLGRLAEAEVAFFHAIAAKPGYIRPCIALGQILKDSGRASDALRILLEAAAAAPDDADVAVALGGALLAVGRGIEAEICFERAVAAHPDHPGALRELARLLLENRPGEAETHLRHAAALRPRCADTLAELGESLLRQNRPAEAVAACDRALAIAGGHGAARLTLATALLLAGDLGRGLVAYATLPPDNRAGLGPLWNGHSLPGRTLLISIDLPPSEAILLLRYIGLAAKRVGAVAVRCRAELAPLLAVQGGPAPVRLDAPPPPHDAEVGLGHLPRLFTTTLANLPAHVPYLAAPQDDRSAGRAIRLAGGSGRRGDPLTVGVCWAGDLGLPYGQALTATEVLAPLASVPGVALFGLQHGPAAADLTRADLPVADLGPHLTDLAAMATAVQALDLIITVEATVADLAGALGRPVWLLPPAHPHWRWLLEREDSPWYPTLRLFRPVPGSPPATMIDRVRRDLTALAAGRKSRG